MVKTPAYALVAFCRKALEEKWGYVWSGQAHLYTKELAEAWGRTGRAGKSNSYYTQDCKKWIGRKVADCSGLICAAIEDFTKQSFDTNSGGLMALCYKSGSISTMPDIPGLLLWREGHVGVHVGGGKCIEAKSTAEGVVETVVKNRTFTRWGMLNMVDYDLVADDPPKLMKPRQAVVASERDPVNVRQTPCGEIVAELPKGHPMTVWDDGEWAQIATFMDAKPVVGWMHGNYVSK